MQGALALFAAANCDDEAAKAMLVGDRRAEQGRPGISRPRRRTAVDRAAAATVRRRRPQPAALRLRLRDPAGARPDRQRRAGPRSVAAHFARRAGRSGRRLVRRTGAAQSLRPARAADAVGATGRLHRVARRRSVPPRAGVSAPRVRPLQRRARSGRSPRTSASIWGVNADAASELIEQPLTEKEEETLQDLNEFNFDDL